MPNTLIKDRDLLSYTPGTAADPGYPGSPATPARTTYRTVEQRTEAPASSMRAVFYYSVNGETMSADSIANVPAAYRSSVQIEWMTPLDVLRNLVGNSGLTASAAHYSDSWGTITSGGRTFRAPVTWTSAWIMQTVKVKVQEPAKPAIPPRPPTPARPARAVYNFHFGWNAGAHSVDVLPADWLGTAQFDIGKPVGAVVGFAPVAVTPTAERSSSYHIKFGLVFGDGIIRLREDGITTTTLGSMTGADQIKAMVFGRTIEWYRNDTLLYRGPFVMESAYYLDAVLYAGNDEVANPSLTDGVEAEPDGAHLMMAALKLNAAMGSQWNFTNRMGAMKMLASEDAICQGNLVMRPMRVPVERGNGEMRGAKLRGLYVSAAEQRQNGFARPVMRRMEALGYMSGGDDAWIPKYSIGAMGFLPVVGVGTVLGGQNHHYELQLRALDLMASQSAYGESRLAMLPMTGVGDMEAITNVMKSQELLGAVPTLQGLQYIAIVVAETLSAAGTITIDAVAVLADASETIGVEDEASVVARILATLVEQLGVFEKYTTLVYRVTGSGPGQVITPVEPGEAWAVNAETNGSTRYDNYLFNSLMTIKGKPFGVKPTGVYLLEGATDGGTKTQAGVSFGTHDFNTQVLKRIEAVYVGVSSTGALVLKISDGKQEYAYRARRADDRMKVQRFDPGKGLRANYFTFELLAQDGQAFELDNITFNLAATKRRI